MLSARLGDVNLQLWHGHVSDLRQSSTRREGTQLDCKLEFHDDQYLTSPQRQHMAGMSICILLLLGDLSSPPLSKMSAIEPCKIALTLLPRPQIQAYMSFPNASLCASCGWLYAGTGHPSFPTATRQVASLGLSHQTWNSSSRAFASVTTSWAQLHMDCFL